MAMDAAVDNGVVAKTAVFSTVPALPAPASGIHAHRRPTNIPPWEPDPSNLRRRFHMGRVLRGRGRGGFERRRLRLLEPQRLRRRTRIYARHLRCAGRTVSARVHIWVTRRTTQLSSGRSGAVHAVPLGLRYAVTPPHPLEDAGTASPCSRWLAPAFHARRL